ncbi:MAG TPA: cyclic nucleotide-binding domain-containing protein, partial [Vicinamibacterales bacterium]|nr:cyclic nucleotide-binding domain-containing protein [Vicinamibacterales bacterium]
LAVGMALLGVVRDFTLALVAMTLASAGTLLLETVATTLNQRIVPDAVRGRTLGTMHTVSVSAYALGALVLPILAASQPTAVLVGCGVLVAASGVAAVVLLGRHAVQEPQIDPVIRKLADVPMFAGLPPGRIETAMRAASVRKMRAGEVIIRQGDEADNFYVISEGTVEVTQTASDSAESRVLRRMGPTEFFGEIGLLSGVPRTATVTAAEAGTLISLPGPAFLELVSGGPGLTYQLLDLHRGATAD